MRSRKADFFKFNSLILAGLLTLATTGCSVKTVPTTSEEQAMRAVEDKKTLFAEQEEIIKPVTLYEAIARAMKYNVDQRVALMEQSISYGVSDEATLDLLPKIAANGGFSSASKKHAISATSVRTGNQTLEESYVSDRTTRQADLQAVYNVLDFGISYVNAKQTSDRRFITEELRRKAIQKTVHDVKSAFWKAAAAQRVTEDLAALTTAVQEELVRVNAHDVTGKTEDQLNEQKRLILALQELMQMRNDILTAKAELALLMNVPTNVDFELDIPPEMDATKAVKDFGVIDLETAALINRPELRINDYDIRIASYEAKKEILRMFPGIEFNAGLNYNSNSYLMNKNWADAGMGVTWNLMNLFTRPKAYSIAKDKIELEKMRRVAMTMAVLSQINVSFLRLRQDAESFEVADSLDKVTNSLFEKSFLEKSKTVRERRATLLAAVERLNTHLRRDFAFADFKSAESNLITAMGIDPMPAFSPYASVGAIAEALQDSLSRKAPRLFKDVSYDRLPSDKAKLTALSPEQRAKLLEWTSLRRMAAADAPLANRALNNPVMLKGAVAQQTKAVKQPKPAVIKKKKAPVDAGVVKLLQLSSFEKLDQAQIHWQELVAVDPSLKAYAPIFREVNIPNKGVWFRTFVADNETKLKDICRRLAVELKSCLIVKQ